MTDKIKEVAKCRGCKMELRGEPYYRGGDAFHPKTGKRCPVNYYGGFVCSKACDFRSCLELEQSMPGHGGQKTVGQDALIRIQNNWPEDNE